MALDGPVSLDQAHLTGTIVGPPPPVSVQAGPATMVGQLAGRATAEVPLMNITTGTADFTAGDLGIMWDDGVGHTLVAYGDSFGQGFALASGGGPANNADHRCNVLGRSATPAPGLSAAMSLSLVTDASGVARSMVCDTAAAATIPTAGVSVDGVDYLDYMAVRAWGAPGVWQTSYAGLASSTDDGQTWTPQPGVRWPNDSTFTDHFQQAAVVHHNGSVYLFGTPNGRFGDAYLASVPDTQLLTPGAYTYWTGTTWQTGADTLAAPIVTGHVAELSVQFNAGLGLWLMTYLDTPRGALVLRYAQYPTGPWSGEQVILQQSGVPSGTFGIYGGFMHPWSTGTDLYLTVSLWSPYQVFLMRVPLTRGSSALDVVTDPDFGDPMDGYARTNAAPPAVFGWSTTGRAGIDVGLGSGYQGADDGWVRDDTHTWNDLHQTVSVVPGQHYSFSAWVRTSSTNVAAHVGVRDESQTTHWEAGPLGSLGPYTQVSLTFDAGANAQVDVYAGTWPTAGVDTWIQVANFSLTPIPTVVPGG